MARVLLVSVGTAGDLFPLLGLAHALRSKGAAPAFACSLADLPAVQSEGFPATVVPPNLGAPAASAGLRLPPLLRFQYSKQVKPKRMNQIRAIVRQLTGQSSRQAQQEKIKGNVGLPAAVLRLVIAAFRRSWKASWTASAACHCVCVSVCNQLHSSVRAARGPNLSFIHSFHFIYTFIQSCSRCLSQAKSF